MSINIITQFNTKPGRAQDLIALISKLLPESLEHAGCEEVAIRQNQDVPDDVISAQRWTTGATMRNTSLGAPRTGHRRNSRTVTGTCNRYFNDVLTRAARRSRDSKSFDSDAPGG